MEPVSVIGLVGAVLGIVNVVGHSVVLLSNLGARLKAADLTVTLLIGQLNAVKAALRQIQLWLEEGSGEDPNHFQLSLDLESSLRSCGILVGLIDDQLSKLEWDENDVLKFESRARIILEDARTKECLNYLNHLISSLSLLLIAFKCRNTKDQKRLLEDARSREVFNQLKEDSSSLIVMYDSASFSSKWTTTTTATSNFSIKFAFDAELLKHRAYQSTIRSLMRRTRDKEISRQLASLPDPAELIAQLRAEGQTATSHQVGRCNREEKRFRRGNVDVILFGLPGSGMAAVIRKLIADYGIWTGHHTGQVPSKVDFQVDYRVPVIEYTIRSLQATIEAMLILHENNLDAENPLEADVELLRGVTGYDATQRLPLDVSVAMIALCNSHLLRQFLGHKICQVANPPTASYFFDSIERILAADYVPTEDDIYELSLTELSPIYGPSIIAERIIYPDSDRYGPYRLLECRKSLFELQRFDLQRLERIFERDGSIVFTAGLSSYVETYIEKGRDCQNKMLHNLALVELIAEFTYSKSAQGVIILLNNRAKFEDLIPKIPLTTVFPEYMGGSDVHLALQFIIGKIRKILLPHHWLLDICVTEDVDGIAAMIPSITDKVLFHHDSWLQNR